MQVTLHSDAVVNCTVIPLADLIGAQQIMEQNIFNNLASQLAVLCPLHNIIGYSW